MITIPSISNFSNLSKPDNFLIFVILSISSILSNDFSVILLKIVNTPIASTAANKLIDAINNKKAFG
ncbi:MAG: hypothetical protein Q4P31_04550 [Andreesenia angusta]|nr:hypothetical protein [Andreesenia angusta]